MKGAYFRIFATYFHDHSLSRSVVLDTYIYVIILLSYNIFYELEAVYAIYTPIYCDCA